MAAARGEFQERGFDKATIRGIAAAAGVDPALVHHYYGSKQDLFVAVMELPPEIPNLVRNAIAGDPDTAGERLARFFFGVWDRPNTISPFLTLLRSAVTNEQAAAMLREFITDMMVGPVTEQVAIDHAPIRAPLAASQMVGIAMLRYVIGIEPMKSASVDQLVAIAAPTLQHYLRGPLPDSAVSRGETAGSQAAPR